MKYMWTNKDVQDSVNMKTVNEDFVGRTEYNLKMITNSQKISPKKMKRFRSAFTTDQVNYLETQFKKFPYIGNAQRKEVAVALNIPERAVKIWFQNRRMKEKKETTGKEFDDDTSIRKSLEFAKDQLNNVGTPSANDQKPYPLPLLTDINKASCDKVTMTNNSPCSLSTGLLIADSGFTILDSRKTTNNIHSPTSVKPSEPISPNNFIKSAEFSIDLCKKYKNEPSSNFNHEKPILVMDQDIKQTIEQKPIVYKHIEQTVPEDLSSTRKMKVPTASQTQMPHFAPSVLPNNPGYISVIPTVSPFYAQPYYSASGVLWKPLNVMSTATTPGQSIPVSVPNGVGTIPIVQESVPKKCCTCDCHVKPLVPYNLQQQSASPQYIITAVQFPNPSASKF